MVLKCMRVMDTFWECHQMVPIQNGFHGPAFPATRGTTQGVLISLTMFNVVVDNVIRTWLTMTVEDQKLSHDGLLETACSAHVTRTGYIT